MFHLLSATDLVKSLDSLRLQNDVTSELTFNSVLNHFKKNENNWKALYHTHSIANTLEFKSILQPVERSLSMDEKTKHSKILENLNLNHEQTSHLFDHLVNEIKMSDFN